MPRVNINVSIQNEQMLGFCKDVLSRYPNYGWVPSSKSGKYHPADEYRAGGNSLHLARVLRVLQHLFRDDEGKPEHRHHIPLTQEEKDLLVVAAILHDINKTTWKGNSNVGPNIIAQELHESFGRGWKSKVPWGIKLVELVAVHGGAFYKDAHVGKQTFRYDPENKLHRLLHLADYIASRNDITVDVSKTCDKKNWVPRYKWFWMKWFLKIVMKHD